MSGDIETAALALRAAVTGLQGLDRSECTPGKLLDLLRELDTQAARQAWVTAELVAELDSRTVAHDYGARDTRALLMQQLHLSGPEAGERVRLAGQVGSRTNVTGEDLGPIYPHTSDALKTGEISAAQVRIIDRTIEAIPNTVEQDYLQDGIDLLTEVESHLIAQAHNSTPSNWPGTPSW